LVRIAPGLVAAIWPRYLIGALLVVGAGDLGARSYAQQGNESYAPLKARIARRLAWDRKLAPFQLGVEVNGAVVKLIGVVSTGAERQRADRIAHDVTGVLAVVNGLKVDPALATSGGVSLTRPNDNTLEKRIANVIDGDARVAVENIRVNVEDGHVSLRGRVPELTHQVRAGRMARSLFGVRSIDNKIRLEQPSKRRSRAKRSKRRR
jgi:osmotically-inducible protein OsmY